MLLQSILLVVVLHGVHSYYFYNPQTHHVLTLPSLANVPRGYKLVPPPFQRRSMWQGGHNHMGQCMDPGFICTRPYDISATYQFRCSKDAQCPRFHKCCPHRCFVHNICMKSTMQPRHTPKTTKKLKDQRAGTCEKWLYNCPKPYHYSLTSIFKCDYDGQCPKSFKCCEQSCFKHKICSRAIIHNDGYVEELRIKEFKTIVTPEKKQTPNKKSTETDNTNGITTDENNKKDVTKSTVKPYEETTVETTENIVKDVTESTVEPYEETTIETTENVVDSTSETTTVHVPSESPTTSESDTEETTETTNGNAETTTESLIEETTNEDAEENVSTTDESEYSSVLTTGKEDTTDSTTELSTEENVSTTNKLEYSSDITTEAKDIRHRGYRTHKKNEFTVSKSAMEWSTPDPNAIIPEYANFYYDYDANNETAYDSDSYN
ncbi:uncharacterized protein [Leptinotarsa decemlineata]|uniref:uncharacterized protein n=1 Tax=Leptinotarsa decemlineata TaxID=7539 RepID=UPI003D306DA8